MGSKINAHGTLRDRGEGELRRPVIIDAFTVCAGHVNFREGPPNFSIKGLVIVFKELIQMGHKVLAFVPPCWLRDDCAFVYDGQVMNAMKELDLVRVYCVDSMRDPMPPTFKYFNWLKFCIRRDTLKVANDIGAVIISSYQYRPQTEDTEPMAETYKQIIANKLFMPTFSGDEVYLPLDGPKGRRGRKLDDVIKCMPGDEDYRRCNIAGVQLQHAQQTHLLHKLTQLLKACKMVTPMYKMDSNRPTRFSRNNHYNQRDDVSEMRERMYNNPDSQLQAQHEFPSLIQLDDESLEVPVSELIKLDDSDDSKDDNLCVSHNGDNAVANASYSQSWMAEFDPIIFNNQSSATTSRSQSAPVDKVEYVGDVDLFAPITRCMSTLAVLQPTQRCTPISLATLDRCVSVPPLVIDRETSVSVQASLTSTPISMSMHSLNNESTCNMPLINTPQSTIGSFQHTTPLVNGNNICSQSLPTSPIRASPIQAYPPISVPTVVGSTRVPMVSSPIVSPPIFTDIASGQMPVETMASVGSTPMTCVNRASSPIGEWCNELRAVFGDEKVAKACKDNPDVKNVDLLAAVILASDQN